MHISQLKSESEDAFRIFENATRKSFDFLMTDFGFSVDSPTLDESMSFADMLTCSVKYRNETTEIKASYTWYEDLRGTPQIICGRLKPTEDGNLVIAESYNLDMLIVERAPARALLTFPRDPIERIEKTMQAYASIVADCAQPELAGDFTVFPRLRNTLLSELKGAVLLHSDVDANGIMVNLESESS
jgi:hypothetical protein